MECRIEAVTAENVGTMKGLPLAFMAAKSKGGALFKITHFADAVNDKGEAVKIVGRTEYVTREKLQAQIAELQAKLDQMPAEEKAAEV
jgi:hypothetical protein